MSSQVCSFVSTNALDPREVLLPTAWVTATARNGRSIRLRALIDQGSQASLVSEDAVQRLGIKKRATNLLVTGVGSSSVGKTHGCVQFVVSPSDREGAKVKLNALVLPVITSKLPSQPIQRSEGPQLKMLCLADMQYGRPGRVDLLLGSNVVSDVLLDGVKKENGLVAQNTIFGWVVSGNAVANSPCTNLASMHMQLDVMLQRFWEQEEVHQRPIMSHEEAACEASFNTTTVRASDGHYVVDLPFRQGGRELGESRANAVRRLLAMERKGSRYPEMYAGYIKFMQTYEQLGHMERIPVAEINEQPQCYLPHHAVFKEDSTTTKLRVVFDATAATTNGNGLNDLLLVGPRLQETLAAILMRWRKNKIAITADIEKMYRQIWVQPAHCNYQRIVWRERETDSIVHYRLKTVTYGTASAPYLAVKTIQRLADDEEQRFPRAAMAVRNDFYVDDCMTGADTIEEAHQLKDELLSMMKVGGLRLLKWASNSADLLASLPEDHIECHAPLRIDDEDDHIKALGVHWFPAVDEIGYKVRVPEITENMSKRQMLSEIARLFDPLGLLAPIIITAKTIMQRLWLTGLEWDDTLPEDVRTRWHKFQQELPLVEQIRIRRWYGYSGHCRSVQLHGFADASLIAYSACVYLRVEQNDGTVMVTLVAAKTKVAPIKQQSIPRLELCGAVLLTRLLGECQQALRCDEAEMFAWSDSTVVLAWLQRHANVWQTYVANRVSEIQSSMNVTRWQHVSGVDNPADVASRGIMPSEIRTHVLWWSGPAWLQSAQAAWPQQEQTAVDEALLETKKTCCQIVQLNAMWELADKYSSWRRLLRVTAYLRRMIKRPKERVLLAGEIDEARRAWVLLAQAHEFGDAVKLVNDRDAIRRLGLLKLRPIIGTDGILRVGGRLANAGLTYDEQHPMILPARSVITKLIIRDAHEQVFHRGAQSTMGQLHLRYWVLNERRQVRSLVHKCIICAKLRPRGQHQIMGNLPASRVQASRPFLHTGVDYAGPIWSRTAKGRGHKAHKSWIAVFVCFCTKAVHLELVSDVSAAAFIAAYRRFAARRGVCSDIYCDNGKNFVGADRELKKQLAASMRDDGWRVELAESGTRFHFSPPGSPHFNGLAEATVKMAKAAMKKVLGESTLTFEELSTFLAQVEAALNSRPLCAVSTDADDDIVLTPGHFLIGRPILAVPGPNELHEMSNGNRWHLVQQLATHFWRRWSREYLHQLQQRQKWATPTRDIEVGDVVLVHDETLVSNRWRIGRVTHTHPGADGHVRVVSVKTSNGSLKRSIVRVSVLPIENVNK